MSEPQIQHEFRYLMENYQCYTIEFSYPKHIVCSEAVISELSFSSCMCASFSLKSLVLFDVPLLGLIFCIHNLFLCAQAHVQPSSLALLICPSPSESSLESFIKIKISKKLCHWKTGSYTCLLTVRGIGGSPYRHTILACIYIFHVGSELVFLSPC